MPGLKQWLIPAPVVVDQRLLLSRVPFHLYRSARRRVFLAIVVALWLLILAVGVAAEPQVIKLTNRPASADVVRAPGNTGLQAR
jgi:hypothetical protein